MKRWKRWIAVLVSLLLCVSLCGCSELDAMQAAHGIWVDANTITWNGYTYTLLEGYWTDLNVESAGDIYVTEKDVPVLLSNILGKKVAVNSGGTMLYYYEYDPLAGASGERVFCRNDLLEWMEDAFINGYEMESYRFEYWNDIAWEKYTLTADQRQAVDTVLDTVDPFAVEYYDPSSESVALYGYSAYDVFVENVGWIDQIDGQYYIFRENDHDGYGWNTDCYIVPEDLYAVFDSIMDAKTRKNPAANSNPTAVYPPSVFA